VCLGGGGGGREKLMGGQGGRHLRSIVHASACRARCVRGGRPANMDGCAQACKPPVCCAFVAVHYTVSIASCAAAVVLLLLHCAMLLLLLLHRAYAWCCSCAQVYAPYRSLPAKGDSSRKGEPSSNNCRVQGGGASVRRVASNQNPRLTRPERQSAFRADHHAVQGPRVHVLVCDVLTFLPA
jgi:hypothetical protein